MSPTLSEGDTIIYRTSEAKTINLREGLILIIKSPLDPSLLIIKRLHKYSPLGMDIRGDNEITSSDSRNFGLVNQDNLEGVVEQIIPRFYLQNPLLKFWNKPTQVK